MPSKMVEEEEIATELALAEVEEQLSNKCTTKQLFENLCLLNKMCASLIRSTIVKVYSSESLSQKFQSQNQCYGRGWQLSLKGRRYPLTSPMAQPIHDSTKLLLSSIELPEDAVLQYTVYSSPATDALQQIESVRRKLLELRTESFFEAPISHVYFSSGVPLLYLFRLVSAGDEPLDVTVADLSSTQ